MRPVDADCNTHNGMLENLGREPYLVQRPLGFVVEAGGGVQVHHLVVLHREVMARALQVRNLHKHGVPR